MRRFKYWLILSLWRIPYIRRNYCWAEAVSWIEFGCTSFREIFDIRADHKCFYCLTCNTEEEIEEYRRAHGVEAKE